MSLKQIFIEHLKREHRMKEGEIKRLFIKKPKKEISQILIPVYLFKNRGLSSLGIIVKYLKENAGLKYCEIADILKRNDRTIWTTYKNSLKKYPKKFSLKKTRLFLPVTVVQNRELSVLEAIVSYLKKQGFSLSEIALLLNRDQRTIWTIDFRLKEKDEKHP